MDAANVDVDRLTADGERCLVELESVGVGRSERFDHSLVLRVEWLADPVESEPDRRVRPAGEPSIMRGLPDSERGAT